MTENQTLFAIIANEHLVHAVTHPAIEQIAQRHRDFVSVVSHEFRTPLTSIKGYADTMLRYSANLTDEQQTKFISTIKEQADRLTRMVENLLTVSKLGEETIQLDFRSIGTNKLIQNVSANILAKGSQDKLYANREIDCKIADKLPPLWGDPDKVEQVVTNIVDNAVKYAFENTTITITTQENDNAQLTISVTNKGAGIPQEQIPSIFKRFSRADDPLTRQVEGTGLGLYITKSLVEAMNGHITVDSVQQEETTFHLTLPMATDERQAAYNKSRGVDEAWILENGE
jgi:signal transduction histidine kinase